MRFCVVEVSVFVCTRDRLVRLQGDGRSWVAEPALPYALVGTGGELLAGMADGRLLRSGDLGESWHEIGARLDSITAPAPDE